MQAPYPPPSAPPGAPSTSQFVTRVQLNISCRNLRDKDVMSKSDPMAVVMSFKDGGWFEVNSVHRHIFDFISRMFLFRNQPSIEIA